MFRWFKKRPLTEGKDSKASLGIAPNAKILRCDGVSHYKFCATLKLTTPLRVLEMDDMRVAFGQPLPDYRENPAKDPYSQFGIWFPVMSPDILFPESDVASDIGPIKPSYYIPFLKEFRKIVESDLPSVEQIQNIRGLKEKWPEIYGRFFGFFGDLADWWFLSRLRKLGVGNKIAKELYSAGYFTLKDVQSASDEALDKIPGLGIKKINKIKQTKA